jgi:ABC-type antimicrobial peptide transport system permease subunit
MFYLTYLRRELRRRAGRTALTVSGLAVGVALVVAITAVSSGLDDAQARVLDPLASVGTDLLVTRPVETPAAPGTGQAPAGTGGFRLGGGGLSPQDQQALMSENASVLTDLSKLGKAGDRFVHDFFLPATQLTFPADQADAIAKLPGVSAVAQGLSLLAQHQEGTVPEIVAELETGGETLQVDQQITPPTPAEEAQIQACLEKAGMAAPGSTAARPVGPPPEEAKGGDSQGRVFIGGGALNKCMPERFQRFRGSVTTPQRTLRQVLNPPQTDIKTDTYTIAGVDPSAPGLGLLTPAQVTDGRFLGDGAEHEAVLAEAYAQRKGLKTGSTFALNGTTYTVVGLAQPPLGGQAADVYLSLSHLQSLASRSGRANVLLVRADRAADVADLTRQIEEAFPGATVTSAKQLAENISGSLVDAANLAKRLGRVLAAVVLIAAFLVAALLTLSSVSKRVRELGTLKAVGWRQSLVVRQVIGESTLQGLLGGLLGVAAGVGAAALAVHFAPALHATAATAASSGAGFFGLGQVAAGPTSAAIPLSAPVNAPILAAALGLAVLGGLLAGGAGALRAARLRPADALRELG